RFSRDWSSDVCSSDLEIAEIVRSAAAFCEDAGAIVEEASVDFTGADECFRTLRAWQFEATLGEFLDSYRDKVRPSLYANMLQGQIGRASCRERGALSG